MDLEKILRKFEYPLPPELIAQAPAHPRDSARLLVYNRKTKKVSFDRFINLGRYLPPRAVLVFNDTKVLPARLTVYKETGGRVKILYLRTIKNAIEVLADRRIRVGSRLSIGKSSFTVRNKKENHYFLEPSFPVSRVELVLQKYGETPIPPYIKHTPLIESALRKEYQTVFARVRGSVAAPTASLHFTKRLMRKLKASGIDTKFVTLHVGLGTFAPLTVAQIKRGKLHEEHYEIDRGAAEFLNRAKKEGKPIVAVGTTAVRTLESASVDTRIAKLRGETQLFIRERYKFKFIDCMVTNFHVPRSSLLMLVAALAGRRNLLDLYRIAVLKKFRFFSFGDGMLIL